MATRTRKPDENYFTFAISHLVIEMDNDGAYAEVPSEKSHDEHYNVRIDESDPTNVYAFACDCPHHLYRKAYCKHMDIVDTFYQRILHPVRVVAEAVKVIEQVEESDPFAGYDVVAEAVKVIEQVCEDVTPDYDGLADAYKEAVRQVCNHSYSNVCGHLVKFGHEDHDCGCLS
jgi:hypothetical protein